MAFPTTILPLLTEVLINGTWTDVSARRRIADGLNITRGRGDWASRAVASRGDCVFDNADGYFSNRRADSPNFGLLGRNTQLRHRIRWYANTFTQSLATVGVTVSQAVAVSLRDFDITFNCTNPVVPTGNTIERGVRGRYVDASNYVDMRVFYNTANEVRVIMRQVVAGVETATSFVTVAPTTTTGLSVRFQAKGDRLRCKVWAAADPPPSAWTRTLTTTFLTVGTFVLYTVLTAGNTNTLPVVETWDDVQISDYRFWGECPAFAPQWDTSGRNVTVPVEAAGILQRLSTPSAPVRSPMRVAYTEANPTAYWPLEGPGNITEAPSGLSGGAPLVLSGAGLVTFEGIDGPPGSAAVMDFSSSFQVGTIMSAPLPAASGITSWRVEWSMIYKTSDAAYQVVMPGWATQGGDISYWYTDQNDAAAGGFRLHYIDEVSDSIQTLNFFNEHNDGQWHQYRLDAFQSGGNIELEVRIDGVLETSSTIVTRTLSAITSFDAQAGLGSTDPQETGLGHVAVWQPRSLVDTYAAFTGHAGETAATGLARLCEDNGIPFDLIGDAADTTPCGPQRKGSLLDALIDRADTDQGILYEPRDAFGLAYRTRVSLYNQSGPQIGYPDGVLAPPFQPIEDSQILVNDFTAKSPRDAVGRSTVDTGPLSTQDPPNGAGRIERSGEFNPDGDATWLPRIAAHRTALGTWDEARYPVARFEMAAPDLAADPSLFAQVAALDIGDVLTVTDLPAWQPAGPAGLMVQGSTEYIGTGRDWSITFNSTPSGPYAVGAYGDGVVRYDTDHTTTAEALDTTETGVDITVAAGGAGWVTTAGQPAEFPFGITIGGEDMTVTANTSTGVGTYTLTVTRSVNGIVKSHSTGAAVHVKHPGYYAY